MNGTLKAGCALALMMAGMGCAGRPALIPNRDPNLRRTSSEFAADAVKRHPYREDVPRGGEALGRSSVDYTFKTIELLNYSDEDWDNVELWVNKQYVLWTPRIPKGRDRTEVFNFTMFFDDKGGYFVTHYGKTRVESLEMLRNGKMYTIPVKLAD